MNPTSALQALHRLVQHSGSTHDLPGALVELQQYLTRAVPAFLGLQVFLEVHAHRVLLSTLDDLDRSQAVTSLGWCPDGQPTTRLTLYASRAGALVDLAADITWSAHQPGAMTSPRQAVVVELDRALPPPAQDGDILGLDDLVLVSRAEGVLIDEGVHPDDALTELARRAAEAGADLAVYARRVVGGAGAQPTGS